METRKLERVHATRAIYETPVTKIARESGRRETRRESCIVISFDSANI